jgi:phosphoserine phosphatase
MAKTGQLRLLLVRSGATEWDKCGRMCGSSDLPLCEEGRAAFLAELEQLGRPGLATVLTSPDEASLVTAGLLAEATGAKIKDYDELREVNLGLWEGRLGSDLEARCRSAYRQWVSDPTTVVPPEGETIEEAEARIVPTLAKLLGKARVGADGAVGLVMRPLALGVVKCWLEGMPTSKLWTAVHDRPVTEWRQVSRPWLAELDNSTRVTT